LAACASGALETGVLATSVVATVVLAALGTGDSTGAAIGAAISGLAAGASVSGAASGLTIGRLGNRCNRTVGVPVDSRAGRSLSGSADAGMTGVLGI